MRTSKISPKVVLWTRKVLLNHNIFTKFSYDVIIYCGMYLSSDHFSSTWNLHNPKWTKYCPEQCVCGGLLFTSLRNQQDSRVIGKSGEGNPNFARASVRLTQGLHARLTTLIPGESAFLRLFYFHDLHRYPKLNLCCRLRSFPHALFDLVVLSVLDTCKTVTHRICFKSAAEAGKQQRIHKCTRVSQFY